MDFLPIRRGFLSGGVGVFRCCSIHTVNEMTKLSTEIISFDDAGADDDHPVKGITMGHIRRWFEQAEEYEVRLRIIAEAAAAENARMIVYRSTDRPNRR